MHRLRFPFLGYTVILHWSWLIAVSLITWSLATGYYPKIWPEYPRALYWLSGLLSTFLLFFSILLHESAHAGTNEATAATWAVDDVDGTVRDLKQKGVAFEHYDLPDTRLQGDVHVSGSMKAAWFKDPDGNILALVSR